MTDMYALMSQYNYLDNLSWEGLLWEIIKRAKDHNQLYDDYKKAGCAAYILDTFDKSQKYAEFRLKFKHRGVNVPFDPRIPDSRMHRSSVHTNTAYLS